MKLRKRNENGRFIRYENNNLDQIGNLFNCILYIINLLISLVKMIPIIILIWYCYKYFNLVSLIQDILSKTICSYNNSTISNGAGAKSSYF